MKLLIYGGCHAAILKTLIDRLGPPGAHTVDVLINFQLIASGKSFPVDELPSYDAVLYSPIENKGSYNTHFLAEACAQAGVPALGFPWLEWRGYVPTAEKGDFRGLRQWFYPELFAIRERFSAFDAFSAFVRAEYPSDEVIRWNSGCSTGMLIALEDRNDCQIRVGKFIESDFRERRLFITSDHPALAIYRSVIEQAERALGARLVASWPADLPDPQTEERTPILPRVQACHGLRFSDTSWRASDRPGHDVDLEGYLALYFYQEGHELATARRGTRIFGTSRFAAGSEPIEIPPDTRVLIRRSGATEAPDHFTGDIVAAIGAEPAAGRLSGRHVFRREDWECRT